MLLHATNDTGSIKRSHILAFVIMIILIGVAGYGYFSHVKRIIIADKKNELATIAKLKADQISQWRAERIGDASTIHHNGVLAARLADYFAGSVSGTVLDEFKIWMDDLRKSYGYSAITLYKADGSLLVSSHDAGTQLDIISKQLVEQAVHDSEVRFSDLHRDEKVGTVHINLVVPIGHTVGKNFKTTAVMLLDIDPNQFLNPLIQTWPTNSKTAETLLVERSGQDALILNEMRYRRGTALSFRIPLTNVNIPAVRAVFGQEGTAEGIDYRGEDVLSATKKIPGSPWAIVAKIDLSEIYRPIKTRAWWALIFSSLLITGVGSGIYSLWSKQLVKIIQEDEEKYRAVADNIYDWEYWKATDGNIIYCSPSCERITGYSAKKFLQDPALLIRIIHPDDREHFIHHLDVDANGSGPANCQAMDFRINTLDGGERWIAHVCQQIFDANGTSLGRRACNRDITARKQAEETLIRKRLELKAIYDSVPVMLCLVDADRRILYANSAFTVFSGISEDSLEGGHACGVFGCSNVLDDPRGCGFAINCLNCSLMKSIDDAFKTGNPHLNEEHSFIIDHHGNLQEFTLQGSAVLIDSADKNCLLLCLQDITGRKRIENENLAYQESLEQLVDARTAERRESENRYHALFTESPDAYLIIVDNIFVDCNRASEIMLRGDRQQIVGQSPDILSPEYQHDGRASSESAEEKIDAALRDGNNKFEWVHRRFDGSEFFVEVSIAVIPMDGKPALLVSWRDISARKLSEEALRESERLLRESQSIANLGSYVLTLSTGMWTSSDEFDRLFGIDASYKRSIEGWTSLIHPDDCAATFGYFSD